MFRTAVNPSMEAAGKTSLFCTLRHMDIGSDRQASIMTLTSPDRCARGGSQSRV